MLRPHIADGFINSNIPPNISYISNILIFLIFSHTSPNTLSEARQACHSGPNMYTHEVMAGPIVPPASLTPSAVSSQPPQRVDVSKSVKLEPKLERSYRH